MFKVGVIGCGYWGPNLVRVFNDCAGASVTAVCDCEARCLERVCKRYPTAEGHAYPRLRRGEGMAPTLNTYSAALRNYELRITKRPPRGQCFP